MGQSAQEFITAAKAKAREDFEKKRDAHLIRLGLVDKKSIQYSRYQTEEYTTWDPEKQMYFSPRYSPIEVTDEEYEEIKRLTQEKSEAPVIRNGAESFLNVILIIFLIIGIIAALCLFIIGLSQYSGGIFSLCGIALLITSLVNFAVGKVVLNISNNLHSINAKIK